MPDDPVPGLPRPAPEELTALADRLRQVRFVPRPSLEAEILHALRHPPRATAPALPPAGAALGIGAGAALTGLLLYLLWRALLHAAR